MAFTKKEKNFILKNYKELSISKISEILNCSEKQISEFLISQNISSEPKKGIKNKIEKLKELIIGEFEFKTFLTVFKENKIFFITLFILIFLLFSRSFSGIVLSDEQSFFQAYNEGKFAWYSYIYGSSVNVNLSALLFGINLWSFRLFAIILHLINIVLFFAIFRNFFSEKVLKIACILISIHSLIVEPITWIAATPYVYHAFVYLLIMYFSLVYEKTNKWYFLILYYLLILNFTLTGGHTNYTPLLAIAFNLFILKRSLKKEAVLTFWTVLLIPVYGILNRSLIESRVASLTTGPYLEKYSQTLPFTAAKSLELTLLPYRLALFHEETLDAYYYLFAKLLTLGFFGFTIYLFFKKEKIYFGLIAIACASCIYIFSPVQISWFVAERYMYFSVLIACLFWALLIVYLNQKVSYLGNLVFVSFFFFFLFVTFFRFNAWASSISLWEENVRISPDSYRVRNNLAEAYSLVGDFENAQKQYLQSVRINPNFADAYFNVSTSYINQNKFSEAEFYLNKTIELNPSVVEAYLRLAIIKATQNNYPEAYQFLEKARELKANETVLNNVTREIKNYEIKQKN